MDSILINLKKKKWSKGFIFYIICIYSRSQVSVYRTIGPLVSQIFYFRIISEFLNSRVGVNVFYKVYSDSLLVRALNLRGNQFANIGEN